MSTEIVNLRRARKDRARNDKATKAAENRAKFGRPQTEREMTLFAREQSMRRLDGHRLKTDDEASR